MKNKLLFLLFVTIVLAGCKPKKSNVATFRRMNIAADTVTSLVEKEKSIWSQASNNEEYMTRTRDLNNDSVHDSFIALVEQDTATMSYDFPLLQKEAFVHIATSEDKNLRIYSWDTGMGGTMSWFDNILQYRYEDKIQAVHQNLDSYLHATPIKVVNVREEGEEVVLSKEQPTPWIDGIYDLTFDNGDKGYLIFKSWSISASHYICAAEVMKVTGRGLEPVKCFKIGNKKHYSVGSGPDMYENDGHRVSVPHHLEFNPKTHVLKVPIITGFFDFKGYESYLFNGNLFVNIKGGK